MDSVNWEEALSSVARAFRNINEAAVTMAQAADAMLTLVNASKYGDEVVEISFSFDDVVAEYRASQNTEVGVN